MRVGSIVLATHQGLGVLAKDFHDNGIVDEVLIKHSTRFKNNLEWYPAGKTICENAGDFQTNILKKDQATVVNFLSKIDVLLLFEIPFVSEIIPLARTMGVKIAMMPMYECTPYPQDTDIFLCPSELDLDVYRSLYPDKKCILAQVPVPRSIEWKQRTKANVFVHNAGNGGTYERNGTKELIQAMRYVKSSVELVIRTQKHDFISDDNRIVIHKGTIPYEELWKAGDVFIFPEKFNGLSLPIQEAYASGMMIMTSDRHPNNKYLPTEPLIPTAGSTKTKIVNVDFDIYSLNPEDIAAKIDEWHGKDITEYSKKGKEWGENNSWDVLAEFYKKTLTEIL